MANNTTICSNNISTNQMNSSSVVSNIIKFKERSNAISDTSSYGQLWVKTATPNQLYFTTDAGDDIQLTSGTSVVGGGISTVTNGADDRIATFSSSNSLNGETNLTFDGSTLTVSGSNPQVRIGDEWVHEAQDTSLVFMGSAQDFYIAIDDTTDDLTIGSGTTIGSNVRMVVENDGNVGIGTITPNQKLTIEGTMSLKEQANANTDTAAYGQLWVKTATPNELYFTTDAGDDIQITSGTSIVGSGSGGGITFGKLSGNALKSEETLTTNDVLLMGANHVKGRTYAEFKSDISLNNVENTAISTFAGSSNITTLGTITTGTWNGTAIADAYISSASTWNNKQAALTFGISSDNVIKCGSGIVDDDFLRINGTTLEGRSASEVLSDIGGQAALTFGKSSGNALKSEEALTTNDVLLMGTNHVKGRTYAELKTDLSLNNVENTAISTFAGSSNITTLGTISGNLTVDGDLILDDGGSIKEAGGTAAITISAAGEVTKIGQDTPSSGQFLKWDGSKVVWDAGSGVVSAVSNGVDNRIATFSSSDALNGEANLTFDGSLLTVQDSDIAIQANSADANDLQLIFQKSRHATDGSHTVVQDNDKLGSIEWYGSDGTDYAPAASIFSRVNGTPGDNDMPTELVFATTSDGANAVTERMTINSSGNIGIGTTDPEAKLTVEGTIKLKEQADADADTAAYGQLWVNTATPNELYFTTDAGDDIQITSGTSIAGGGGVSGDTFATDLKIGRDSDNNIDFSTDNRMIFTVDGFEHLKIQGDSAPAGEITIGGSNKDGSIFVGPNGNRTLFLGNARHSNANTSIAGKSGIYFQYHLTTIADSATTVTADHYITGYIKCTGGDADTWTLPTGGDLHEAIDDVLDSPYGSSRHFVEGYSFTTYVINESGGGITYAAGASGSTLNSVTGNLVQANNTVARLDFIFTDMTGGSEKYHCLLHCTN